MAFREPLSFDTHYRSNPITSEDAEGYLSRLIDESSPSLRSELEAFKETALPAITKVNSTQAGDTTGLSHMPLDFASLKLPSRDKIMREMLDEPFEQDC